MRSHESLFWRRLAHWGASRGPDWWVRYSPHLFGWLAAALVPTARRAVLRNLRHLRGEASFAIDTRDVLATFSNYACCLAEILSNDAANGPRLAQTTVVDRHFWDQARSSRAGVILVTAHTAGWESVGPALAREEGLHLTLVMRPEADARARELQDESRKRAGVAIAHVGDDPLAALPLLHELRAPDHVVALQIDRVAEGMRSRDVDLLGQRAQIPEGPLRLAQMSGAPIVPVFSARRGYRDYVVQLHESRTVSRRASDAELDAVAQHLADCMGTFLRRHPTQWFHFGR